MTGIEVLPSDLVECRAVVKINNCFVLAVRDLNCTVVNMGIMKYLMVRLSVAKSLMMYAFEGRCLEVEIYHSSDSGTVRVRVEAMLGSNGLADEAHVHTKFVEDSQVYSNLDSYGGGSSLARKATVKIAIVTLTIATNRMIHYGCRCSKMGWIHPGK